MRLRALGFVVLVLIVLIGGFAIGCATSGQPHMNAALSELQAARSELEVAVADKGGHRVRAIGLVDNAISETQAGIDFAAAHH